MSLPKPKPCLNFTTDQLQIITKFAKAIKLKELRMVGSKIYQNIPIDKNHGSFLLVADFNPVLGSCINFHVATKELAKLTKLFNTSKEKSIIIEEEDDIYKIINRSPEPSSKEAIELALHDIKIKKVITPQEPVYKLTITKKDFFRVCKPFCLEIEKIKNIRSFKAIYKQPIGFIINSSSVISLGLGDYNKKINKYELMISPFINSPLQNKPADLILESYYFAPIFFNHDAEIKLVIQHDENNNTQNYWMFTKVDFDGVIIDIIEPLKNIFMQNRLRTESEITSSISMMSK